MARPRAARRGARCRGLPPAPGRAARALRVSLTHGLRGGTRRQSARPQWPHCRAWAMLAPKKLPGAAWAGTALRQGQAKGSCPPRAGGHRETSPSALPPPPARPGQGHLDRSLQGPRPAVPAARPRRGQLGAAGPAEGLRDTGAGRAGGAGRPSSLADRQPPARAAGALPPPAPLSPPRPAPCLS